MAEQVDLWSSANLGDIGTLKPFFEAAAKGLELHKENAAFIKTIYEFNKAYFIASVDPLFAALDKIFQEILKLLDDLRGLGFYYLPVHSKSIGTSNEVQRNPITGGLLIGGQYYAKATMQGAGEYVKADIFAGDIPATDKETGEQIYVKDTAWEDPLDADGNSTGTELTLENAFVYANEKLGLTQLSPMGILQTIDRSFDDLNDVPKGNTAFTTDTSQLLSEDYYLSGRPIFSNSATVGGIIIIMGAPSLDHFGDILKTFNKFIDLESFHKLLAEIDKILNPPIVHRIKLSWVSTKTISVDNTDLNTPPSLSDSPGKKTYIEEDDTVGSFYVHEKNPDGTYKSDKVLKNTVGKSIARVNKVIDTHNMIIEDRETVGHKADTHNTVLTESVIKRNHQEIKINRNMVPYQNQELEISYMSPGMEFKKGDIIVEAVPSVSSSGTQTKEGTKIDLNKQNEGDPGADKEYVQVTEGELIVGKVVDEFYADALPEKPDWRGKRLEELIPPLGSILDTTETHVRSIFATIKSYHKTLDPIIKYLDGKMDELQAFSKEIEEILELFAVGIPATGVYTLYLSPQLGGTAYFRERMMAAAGPDKPPENLKFCAGVCFLGGGPTGGPLITSLKALALMLGMREKTEAEVKQQEKLEDLSTPIFDNTKTYMAGDKTYYKGVNYECLVNYTTGEEPIIKDLNDENVVNAENWRRLGEAGAEDEGVDIGDVRTPEEIRKAKIEFLKDTKKALGDILVKLNGASPGASSLRKKIMDVPLYGTMDPLQSPPAFISSGANEATYVDLLELRDIDLEELNLLVQRIDEMLVKIEITMIQETPDEETEPGSFRSKGKSLLILKGEFIDEVDDFEGGQRKVKQNTTITILDPLNPASGSTRTVEYMSNTTVAVLNEAFEPDIETALPYDVILSDQNETEYKYKAEYRANSTFYYHPGYRLREFEAKANTISTYSKVDTAGNYIDIPNYEDGNSKGSAFDGKPRNINEYPLGTIIEINGTVPLSEGYIGGGGVEVILEEEEEVADTWNAIGVSQDDLLIVTLDTGTFTKYIQEVLDDTHIAIDSAIQAGGDSPYLDLLYHPDWAFELSVGKKTQKAQEDKIQNSRNKFLDYLTDINAQADEIYDYLDKLNNEGW